MSALLLVVGACLFLTGTSHAITHRTAPGVLPFIIAPTPAGAGVVAADMVLRVGSAWS